MFESIINFTDGSVKEIKNDYNEENNIKTVCIKKDNFDFKKVKFVDVLLNMCEIKANDEGFFLHPVAGGELNFMTLQ